MTGLPRNGSGAKGGKAKHGKQRPLRWALFFYLLATLSRLLPVQWWLPIDSGRAPTDGSRAQEQGHLFLPLHPASSSDGQEGRKRERGRRRRRLTGGGGGLHDRREVVAPQLETGLLRRHIFPSSLAPAFLFFICPLFFSSFFDHSVASSRLRYVRRDQKPPRMLSKPDKVVKEFYNTGRWQTLVFFPHPVRLLFFAEFYPGIDHFFVLFFRNQCGGCHHSHEASCFFTRLLTFHRFLLFLHIPTAACACATV